MSKLNKEDAAFLQALHMYNDAKITEVVDGGGYTMGSDTVVIKVNRMAWGLFEATLLKAMKYRKDLQQRNPDLFEGQKTCSLCSGNGRFDLVPHTPEYDEAYEMFYKDVHGNVEIGAEPYGCEMWRFCSPCQGTGIVLKEPEKNG